MTDSSLGASPAPSGESTIVIVAIALGAAALTVGGLWAFQAWSERSAVPIDDQLPMLVSTEGSAASGEAELATSDPLAPTVEVLVPVVESGASDAGVGAAAGEMQIATQEGPAPAPDLVVHVSGAVLLPGVVSLPAESRVFEAVDLAGGASEDADLDRINLAAPLIDGERIHVPAIGEGPLPDLVAPERPAEPDITTPTADGLEPTVIDLNQASSEELQNLAGIGPATAAAIVSTREQRGPYRAVDELLEVPGIGPAKLELLRPFVRVQLDP